MIIFIRFVCGLTIIVMNTSEHPIIVMNTSEHPLIVMNTQNILLL